jgi:Na+/melibiose symporter-like transporter
MPARGCTTSRSTAHGKASLGLSPAARWKKRGVADQGSESRGEPGEDRKERVSRELIELLNELRVALPGVQVLFAFLLAVPFAQGFTRVTDFQRALYFVVIALTAVSLALLIAPSAWHRLRFRQQDKERILRASNKMSIAGLGFLALAMTGAVMLIADFIYSPTLTIISGIAAAIVYGVLWYVMPLVGPRGPHPDEGQG